MRMYRHYPMNVKLAAILTGASLRNYKQKIDANATLKFIVSVNKCPLAWLHYIKYYEKVQKMSESDVFEVICW